jgi:hypothetical protein
VTGSGQQTWVGFDEHGNYVGHNPYTPDEKGRNLAIRLARAKVIRLADAFRNKNA